MKVNIAVDIPDSTILMLLKKKGKKLVKHDFGTFRKAHHNREVWNEDYRPAVIIDGEYYTPMAAFEKLYSYELQKSVMHELNRVISHG